MRQRIQRDGKCYTDNMAVCLGLYFLTSFKNASMLTCIQGLSVPYARTQVLPHRFDNLKKKKKIDFIREISIMNLGCHIFLLCL